MKRSLLFLLLLALFMPWAAQAQNELTVYEDGTNSNSYVPFNGLWADTQGTASECVIPSDELSEMAGGTITAMKFYLSTPATAAWTGTHQVYLGEIDETTLTGITGPDAFSVVLTGQFDATGTELILEFDEPYTYEGGNLLIGTYVSVAGNYKSAYFTGVNQEENTGWYRNSATASGTAVKFLPKTTFTYTAGAITCAKPKNLAVEYNGGTTATVTWTGDASQYNIDVNGTVTNNVTSPYTLTGLNLATTYQVKVQANCGGGDLSDWTSPKSFATDICMSEDQCNLTFVLTDTYGDGWNGNAIQVKDVATGIVIATLANQNLDGTTGEETQTVTLAVCDGRELEFSWVAGSYPTETQYTVTDINNEVVLEGSGAFETFNFTPNCTPVTCARPTDLAVTYEGGSTATVTWTSDANNFNIDVNGNVTNGVTSPYTLTNLELATTYTVMVQANCGSDGLSNWTSPVSFTTDLCLPEDMCEITLNLHDSYGDGWNGAALAVFDYDSEELLEQFTLSDGSEATYTLSVCDGRTLAFVWSSGNYDSETSFEVLDPVGDAVVSAEGGFTNAIGYVMECESTCRTPQNFTVITGPKSARFSWNELGEATAWVLEYMAEDDEEVTQVNVTTNPFTLTGLAPATYYAHLTADGCEKWSTVISFNVEACPKPDLTAQPYPFSATLNWTDWGSDYELQWTEAPDAKDGGIWLQYDNDTYYTNIGSTTSATRTWGVMYPPAMLQGNTTLTKVAVQESTYYTTDYTVKIYQGEEQPETLLGTETVTPTGANEMHEITLSTPVSISPTQNLWIILEVAGTYVMAACESTERNNQWWDTDSDGVFTNMADDNASLANYGWMIRGYVEGYNEMLWGWSTETGVTPPYELGGLDPERDYVVRVKATCGDSEESDWVWVYFTTPSACDAPSNLETNDVTDNSAMLSWTGYQDRFVLRYRYTDVTDPNAPATIILEAHDAWGDGTGYQMLLDADATAFGVEIPETGPYTGSDYSAFEYLIPENADCSATTENLVLDGSVTLEIPAGVYDWCIVNPEPSSGTMWIAGNGEIPSRNDDFIFEPGVTYHFTMQTGFGSGDGAVYEVIRPLTEWIEEDIAGETEFELTGLNPMTYYEWQVRGENDECTGGEEDGYTEWSELVSFMTTAPQGQTIELAAGWNWVSFYKDITMADLQAAIVAANPGAQPVIKSQADGQTTYNGAIWLGALRNLDLTQMYEIKVANACTITLNGDAIDAANFEITIKPGINWIAYPLNTTMAVATAFDGFSTRLDVVKSRNNGQANFMGAIWTGALKDLVSGEGYIYNSKATASQPFTYPAPAKDTPRSAVTNAGCRTKKVNTIDIELNR